jgi:uncharacterized protein YpiB (UPF0302 family)
MEFTKEELEWLEQEKKNQDPVRIPHDMNINAKQYADLGFDFAWEQAERDYAGFYDPKKVARNTAWNKDNRAADPFTEVA